MDMIERKRLWFEDEKRAQGEAFIRHLERRARRRNWLRFVFNWRQIVDGPDVPVPSPGAQAPSHTGVSAPPGLGSGAAGSIRRTPATHRPVSGSPVPGRPTLHCSEASRISAALNRHT